MNLLPARTGGNRTQNQIRPFWTVSFRVVRSLIIRRGITWTWPAVARYSDGELQAAFHSFPCTGALSLNRNSTSARGAQRLRKMATTPRIQLDELVPQIYDELRNCASRALAGERRGLSIQTTELVHETYVRLARINRPFPARHGCER